MKLLDRYEAEGFYSQDIAQFRAQRVRNGLQQNLSGQQAALEWYPNAGAETFGEGLVLGGEDARDFLFDTVPAAVDTGLTRGVGYAAFGIGKALSWLGVDAGEEIADFGDEMTEYKNPQLEETAQQQYNRHRQYGEKIGNEEKVWKWVYERLPTLSNTLTLMGASGVIGNTVAGTAGAATAGSTGAVTSPLAANTVRATVYNDFLAATAGIGTTAWAVKNAKLLSMAGLASIGDYVEQLGKDNTPTQRVTHALAAGAMEFMSEKLFGGNPLLDDETGALTKLVYRLTENETIRRIVSSAAMDWLGEGFEEVISSVGMMGVDYAMYGKSDATLGQFADDFTMGILVSTIMLGGSKTVEAFCRTDQYGHLKHITQFDHLAQSDLSALNGQMAQYMIRYCCGDEELMRSNGMSEAEIRKAKAAWEKVLAEYNSVYDSLKGAEAYEIAQDDGGEIAGQAAQSLALSSEGRLGDTNTARDMAVSAAEMSQNTAAEVTALSDSDMQNDLSHGKHSDQEKPTVHSLLMETDASKVKNATERKYLKEYQETANRQLAEQQKLDKLQAELDALPNAKRQTSRARFLRDELIKTKNRLQICQSIQTRLETDSPLTYLITREVEPRLAERQKTAMPQTLIESAILPSGQNGESDFATEQNKHGQERQHKRGQIAVAEPPKFDIITTRAAAASIYVNSSTDLFRNAKNISPIEGYEDIVIHGSKYGFEIRNADDKPIGIYSVNEFCDILKDDPNYHGGAIRLISCEAGADGSFVAQGLADRLGVVVLAPTDTIWVFPDGSMVIGEDEFTNSGEWREFLPKRKQ